MVLSLSDASSVMGFLCTFLKGFYSRYYSKCASSNVEDFFENISTWLPRDKHTVFCQFVSSGNKLLLLIILWGATK